VGWDELVEEYPVFEPLAAGMSPEALESKFEVRLGYLRRIP
jgi:hypothetical protein